MEPSANVPSSATEAPPRPIATDVSALTLEFFDDAKAKIDSLTKQLNASRAKARMYIDMIVHRGVPDMNTASTEQPVVGSSIPEASPRRRHNEQMNEIFRTVITNAVEFGLTCTDAASWGKQRLAEQLALVVLMDVRSGVALPELKRLATQDFRKNVFNEHNILKVMDDRGGTIN